LKEKALDRTLWRTPFGRGYGPVVKQTTEWMNVTHTHVGAVRWGTALQAECVIEIFHWHNPSGCTMALRSTWPLTEMNTRNISGGVKAAVE
jgi:hypothetical protein